MRSTYIYLIFEAGYGPRSAYRQARLLSAHTVKYEAHLWVERSMWSFDTTVLWRLRDGVSEGLDGYKETTQLEWEKKA